jgi:dihydroorotate dehydrogenase electron transfer subunit
VRRVRAEILSTRRLGAYHVLTMVAPEIADRARPGQFVAVGMPPGREFVLRRHFSIHQASRRGGWAGTFEFAIGTDGPGTAWLAQAGAHEFLDVIGPLGKAFAYPKRLTNCLLIAEGHGAASLYFLAQELKARHKRVDMIVGAEDLDRVFKPIEGKRLSQAITIMTADGSAGERGVALDALPDMVERCGTQVIYAAAPVRTLERIAAFCRDRKIPAQVAVEEAFGCGVGLCFSCVVPVARRDGRGYDNLRACVDGPVMNPARVLWDRWLSEEPRMIPTPPEGLPVVRSWPG